MPPVILQYEDREAMALDLAEMVGRELRDAIDERGRATLAVPGGTTPGPFLVGLSLERIAWDRVSVMLTDERFVPENSDRSNTRLLRETLLQNNAAAARMIPFYAPGARPEDVLDGLLENVVSALPLDVCVLGMGEDMHTASIFPGADQLELALSDKANALVPMRAPGAPEPRITLSGPVLRGASKIHILISGAAKMAALEKAMSDGPEAEAPIRTVLNSGRPITVHYAA